MAESRFLDLLYDAVALGMWSYTRAAFHVRVLARPGLRLGGGQLLVSTHRAETDVPLICSSIFLAAGIWNHANPRLQFTAREDMFERGFFAGFPPSLPRAARRLLYPLRAGPIIGPMGVSPLPYPGADLLRLGRALEELPGTTALADVLPGPVVEDLAGRARSARRPVPRFARDVLRGEYADLLWRSYSKEALSASALEPVWRRRSDQATEDIRRVIDLVRSREPVLFFPEGRPSLDGTIGPLRPGMRLLVRRGEPEVLLPIGLAYDRLRRGRPLAYFAVGDPVAAPEHEIDGAVLDLLRRTVPLTCGQVVARRLRDAAAAGVGAIEERELDDLLAAEVEAAPAQRRPVDDLLSTRAGRRREVGRAVAWALGRRLVARGGSDRLVLDAAAIGADGMVGYAAREHESARELLPPC